MAVHVPECKEVGRVVALLSLATNCLNKSPESIRGISAKDIHQLSSR